MIYMTIYMININVSLYKIIYDKLNLKMIEIEQMILIVTNRRLQ